MTLDRANIHTVAIKAIPQIAVALHGSKSNLRFAEGVAIDTCIIDLLEGFSERPSHRFTGGVPLNKISFAICSQGKEIDIKQHLSGKSSTSDFLVEEAAA